MIKTYFSHYRGLSKEVSYALLIVFLYSLGNAIIVFLPIYLHSGLQHSLVSTGFAVSLYGFGTIIASFYGGSLCDRFSAYAVLKFSLILSAFLLALLYLIHSPFIFVLILLTLFGMCSAAILPALRVYCMRLCPPKELARIDGIRYMLVNLGGAASMGIAALILGTDYARVFVLSAVFYIFSVVALLLFCKKESFNKAASSKRAEPSGAIALWS